MATDNNDILKGTMAEDAQKAFAETNEHNINTDIAHGGITDTNLEYGKNANIDAKLENAGSASIAAEKIDNGIAINNTIGGPSSINTTDTNVVENTSLIALSGAIGQSEAANIVEDLTAVSGPDYKCAECGVQDLPTSALTPNGLGQSQERTV